jgi:hypothetical protein
VLDLHGFVDTNYARDIDHIISTIRYVFNLFGGAINWMRKRRKIPSVVALSTTKFKYMASTHVSKQIVWLQRLCLGIGFVHQFVRLDYDS